MSFKDYDKSTKSNIDSVDLDHATFLKTEQERIAKRIGAEIDNPVHMAPVDSENKSYTAISPSGAMETAELIRLVGGNFETSILPHRYKSNVVNGGSFSVIEGELVLQTNTAANGKADLQTFNRAEFVTATFNKAHMAVQIDFINTDVRTRFGMFDPVEMFNLGDGIFIQVLNGTLSLNRIKNGLIDDSIDDTQFNFKEKLLKNANVNIYELVYNAGSVLFYQNRVLIHVMKYVDEVGYTTTHLPAAICIENINGATANRTCKTRGFSCSRIGTASAVAEKFNITGSTNVPTIIKHGPASVERIVLGEVGAGNSSLTLFDGPNVFFGPISLTKSLFSLEIGALVSDNLNYTSTGAGYQVMIVYR